MFKRKWCRIAALVVLFGTGFGIVGKAQQAEADLFEQLTESLRKLAENVAAVRDALASFDRFLAGGSARAPVEDSGGPTPDPDPLPDPPVIIPEQTRAQAMQVLEREQRTRNALIRNATLRYHAYVSFMVDRCKAHIAAGDKVSAQGSCRLAQVKIGNCTDEAREINAQSDRLTTKYRPTFGNMAVFGSLYCGVVFSDLADPDRLLREANWQLFDFSCYKHIDLMEEFARTGQMKQFGTRIPLPDGVITSPSEYLAYIQRNCNSRIAADAKQVLDAANKAPAAAPGPLTDSALPSRPDSGLAETFDDAIEAVEQPALDREAAESLEAEARDAAAEADRFATAQKTEADRLSAAAAAKETARTQQEFAGKLAKASAGELFALADEKHAAGDTSAWRETLRALVTRFSNSPYAVMAAKLLLGDQAAAAPPSTAVVDTTPTVTPPPGAIAFARGCVSLITDVINIMNEGARGDYQQEVWRQQIVVRTVNAMPACSAADRATGLRGLTLAQNTCRTAGGADCTNGRNQVDDEARLMAAAQNAIRLASGAAGPAASSPTSANAGAGGTSFAQCESGEATLGERLNALVAANPGNNTLIMRGIIATIDATRDTYRKCLSDPRAQSKIDGMSASREQTLRTCQQISTDSGSCLVSPWR